MSNQKKIDPIEATLMLKEMLKVGKTLPTPDTSKLSMVHSDLSKESTETNHKKYIQEQQILLSSNNDQVSYPIFGQDVSIYPNLPSAEGCSKVVVKNMVDHTWECKRSPGKMIALHISGTYIAYTLKVMSSGGSVLRLYNTKTQERTMFKGFKGDVKDAAFAHVYDTIMLACIDEMGTLFVYKIEEKHGRIVSEQMLHVDRLDSKPSEYRRVIWCPYIPDKQDEIDEDISKFLVVTNDSKAEIWKLQRLANEQNYYTDDNLPDDIIHLSEHTAPITDAIFSPDGNAIATTSLDGNVFFYQVNYSNPEDQVSPKRIHNWCPHDKSPISSLFFIDDYTALDSGKFWKHAITGANNNQEIKLWSCASWSCLQTIRIIPRSEDKGNQYLTAYMDKTSTYLLLSDIVRKVLYIYQIAQDFSADQIQIRSLSVFSLSYPVYCLTVDKFTRCKYKPSNEGAPIEIADDQYQNGEDNDDVYNSEGYVMGTLAMIYWIQPRSLQASKIVYQPIDQSQPVEASSDGGLDTEPLNQMRFLDMNPTLGLHSLDKSAEMREILGNSPSPPHLSSATPYNICSSLSESNTEVLLTPDDFTSSGTANKSACDDLLETVLTSNHLQNQKSPQHSAASSPSREVEEIMAPKFSSRGGEEDCLSPTIKLEPTSPAAGHYGDEQWSLEVNDSNLILGNTSTALPSGDQTLDAPISTELKEYLKPVQRIPTMMVNMDIEKQRIDKLQRSMDSLADKYESINTNFQNFERNVIARLEDTSLTESLFARFDHLHDQSMKRLAADLNQSMSSKANKTLQKEMKQLTSQVHVDLQEAMNRSNKDNEARMISLNSTVSEIVSKSFKNKEYYDNIANSVVPALQSIIMTNFKQLFQSQITPCIEKLCQNLFTQLNKNFHKGTEEYANHFTGVIATHKKDIGQMIEQSMEQMGSFLSQANETSNAKLLKHIKEENKRNNEAMAQTLRTVIQEEYKNNTREQQLMNMRSATATPIMYSQIQPQQLKNLIQLGQFNEAFQQALFAANLDLVIYVCKNSSPQDVFPPEGTCLQQPVLLSLIQQLCEKLSDQTALKITYLEMTLTALKLSDPATREHLRKVMNKLIQKFTSFIEENPRHISVSKMRLMLMAAPTLAG